MKFLTKFKNPSTCSKTLKRRFLTLTMFTGSNFKEAKKKLIFLKGSKKLLHTQKILIVMFRPSKKYPSRDTVPLII
jgi:hypothetical protein